MPNLFPDVIILLFCSALLFAVVVMSLKIRAIDAEKRRESERQSAERRREVERLESEKTEARIEKFRDSVNALTGNLEHFAKMPMLIDGMAALCKVQSETLDQLVKAIGILQKSMSPADTEDYDAVAANFRSSEEQEIENLLSANRSLDREGAAGRVRERRLYEQLGRSRG